MAKHLTVSQEFIQFGANKQLGAELLAKVEAYHTLSQGQVRITESHVAEITKLIGKHTNLKLHPSLVHDYDISIMLMKINGHQGTDGKTHNQLIIEGSGRKHKLIDATIDLKHAKVTGAFALMESMLFIPEAFLRHDGPFTPEETTAMILHEVGHLFFNLATLGEYAWLNYYLTDGIEVLLGRAPNTYRVELLDLKALEKDVTDETLKQELTTSPTEANLRRAVLSAYGANRRHQLGSINGTISRDEQLADMFAARMGFSRPLATAVYKLSKSPKTRRFYSTPGQRGVHMTLRTLGTFWASVLAGTTMATLGIVAFIPAILAVVLLRHDYAESVRDHTYDNPTERIAKLRRELVAQLRSTEADIETRQRLDDDIRDIDKMLSKMNQSRTMVEVTAALVNPRERRRQQRQQHEELLETLLNNDVFVTANRFRL